MFAPARNLKMAAQTVTIFPVSIGPNLAHVDISIVGTAKIGGVKKSESQHYAPSTGRR